MVFLRRALIIARFVKKRRKDFTECLQLCPVRILLQLSLRNTICLKGATGWVLFKIPQLYVLSFWNGTIILIVGWVLFKMPQLKFDQAGGAHGVLHTP